MSSNESFYVQLRAAQRAALDTSRNIALQAGAGSGKTTVLSLRYLWLLESGVPDRPGSAPRPLQVDQILTLTFTRKAAEEMRTRIARLVTSRLHAADSDEDRQRWLDARDHLDGAPIFTIHAFCRSVLEEFSLTGSIDPAFDMVDELEDVAMRQEAIDEVLSGAATEPEDPATLKELAAWWSRPELAGLLGELMMLGDRTPAWFACGAEATTEELLQHLMPGAEAAASQLLEVAGRANFRGIATRMMAMLRQHWELEEVRELRIARLAEGLAATNDAGSTLERAISLAASLPHGLSKEGKPYAAKSFHFLAGAQAKSPLPKGLREQLSEAYREMAEALAEAAKLAAELPGRGDEILASQLPALASLCRRARARYQQQLKRRHLLTFDDLPTLTAHLLATNNDVAAILRSRYRQILVDEYQDTDGQQWEILRHLAADGDHPASDGRIAPAKLFVVGDPKQSIYRFREADVSIFREALRRIEASKPLQIVGTNVPPSSADDALPPQSIIELNVNFRSRPAILRFVNAISARLFAKGGGKDAPDYEAPPQDLVAPSAEATPEHSVHLLLYPKQALADATEDNEDEQGSDEKQVPDKRESAAPPLHQMEAVALTIAWALGRVDGVPPLMVREKPDSPLRPAGPGDVMVLLQRRTHLPELQRRVRMLGIPFVVEKGLGFFDSQEVFDVRNLLACLVDPRDDVALFGLLRGPLISLSDIGIAHLSACSGQTWSAKLATAVRRCTSNEDAWRQSLPVADAEAMLEATGLIEEWRRLSGRIPVAEAIQLAFEQTGALATFDPQALANHDKLVGMARDHERRGYVGAASFLDMLDDAESASLREGMAVVPAGADTVRLMTVHASKGLEAPIVILADPGAGSQGASHGATVRLTEYDGATGRSTTRLIPRAPQAMRWRYDAPQDFRALANLREETRLRDEAEARRLFYVAATRPRDHLILVAQAKPAPKRKEDAATAREGAWRDLLFGQLEEEHPELAITGDDPSDSGWETARRAQAWPSGEGDAPTGAKSLSAMLHLHDVEPMRKLVHRNQQPQAESLPLAEWLIEPTEAPPAAPTPAAPPSSPDISFRIAMGRVGGLLECPSCFRRAELLGAIDRPSAPVRGLVRPFTAEEYGSLLHRAFFEGIDDPLSLAALAEREAAGWGVALDHPEVRSELTTAVARLATELATLHATPLGVRMRSGLGTLWRELSLVLRAGHLRLRGAADVAWRDETTGALYVADLKSGKIPPGQDLWDYVRGRGYQAQVQGYALALAHSLAGQGSTGLWPVRCAVYLTQAEQWVEWDFSESAAAEFESRLRVAGEALATGRADAPSTTCAKCTAFSASPYS